MSGNSSGGIGFFGLLVILLIGLKLTGYITWSWFWLLSPLIAVIIILLLFITLIIIVAIISAIFDL